MRHFGLLLLVCSTAAFAVEPDRALIQVITSPAGAAVSIDGKLVGLSPRSETLSPGVHTFTAELAGATTSQTIALSGGEERKLTLVLVQPLTPRPAPVVGLVTLGGGALSFGIGMLLRLPARAAAQRVSVLFERGGGWDDEAQRIENEGLSAQNWSWVFTGAGAAAMVSGLIVMGVQLFGRRTDLPALVVMPMPGGGLICWGLSW